MERRGLVTPAAEEEEGEEDEDEREERRFFKCTGIECGIGGGMVRKKRRFVGSSVRRVDSSISRDVVQVYGMELKGDGYIVGFEMVLERKSSTEGH